MYMLAVCSKQKKQSWSAAISAGRGKVCRFDIGVVVAMASRRFTLRSTPKYDFLGACIGTLAVDDEGIESGCVCGDVPF